MFIFSKLSSLYNGAVIMVITRTYLLTALLLCFSLSVVFFLRESPNISCNFDENSTSLVEEEILEKSTASPWVKDWFELEKEFNYNDAPKGLSDRMSFRKSNIDALESNSPEIWVNIRKIIFVISFFIVEFYNDSFYETNLDSNLCGEEPPIQGSQEVSNWSFRHLILFWNITTCFELYFSDFLFYMFGF